MDYPLENNILHEVKCVQRNRRGGALPRHIQPRLEFYVSEQWLRVCMVRLWRRGELIRIGGAGARRGYRLPTLVERLAFRVTGMYPFGAEQTGASFR